MNTTHDLFDATIDLRPSLGALETEAMAAIRRVLLAGHACVVQFSGGKDSTVCAALTLHAARDLARQGHRLAPIVIMNSDTLVENPNIRDLVGAELARMRAFGKRHNLVVKTHVCQPALLSTFQLKTLSGRGLPSYKTGSAGCSVDLKVAPSRRARKEMLAALGKSGKPAVTILGTRLDESARRRANMLARGERHDEPVPNAEGELILSPLARWSTDDVFEFLAGLGEADSYTDAADVMRIYAHSGGTSCAVVSAAILEGNRARGGCGARTGCWVCQQAVDKSLTNMVAFDDEAYGYAKPLLRANAVLAGARTDWSLRHWVGRTSREGFVAVEPDVLSFTLIRELTRAFMSIDEDERQRAEAVGEAPKFEILPPDMLVALDFFQGIAGIARPFQIWADLKAIRSGKRFALPEPSTAAPTPMPVTRFLEVGPEWDDAPFAGLRSAWIESLTETSACAPGLVELKSGQIAWALDTASRFEVDPEVALFLCEDMLEDLVAMHNSWRTNPQAQSAGWLWYLGLGTPSLGHGHQEFLDILARRTSWKMARGLALDAPHTAAIAQSVRFADMPSKARQAWSKRASSEGCQLDLLDLLAV
jgi:3'-phosphoadenosine 5'-phosphosulfate sulfotransferase (PAPS reductase)/FAD synthetase